MARAFGRQFQDVSSGFITRPSRSEHKPHATRRTQTRFRLELLEDRTLLSATVMDDSVPASDLNIYTLDMTRIVREYADYLTESGHEQKEFHSANPLFQIDNNRLLIDAVAATETSALSADLQSLGMQVTGTYGRYVSGWLPVDSIDDMNALSSLKFARAVARPVASVGDVTSQGDAAMRSDDVRNLLGFDGTGVKVGVLSDSFDTSGNGSYADDQASGDLPPGIDVLEDFVDPDASDEGRGMLQLIHDVAPGANLAFATAYNGQAGFANNIIALRDAGADVIVDDVFYTEEPMFQDGIIAQAVDTVVSSGVAYFGSAGNADRRGYESDFRDGGDFAAGAFACPDAGFLGGTAHDFDPGPGIDIMQSVTIPADRTVDFALNWDSPFFSVSGGSGSPNDVNVYFFDDTGTNCIASVNVDNAGGDAIELFFAFSVGAPITFNLMFVNRTGPDPGFLKYVMFGRATVEYATDSGTVYGHHNAVGTESVGAAAFYNTPEFGVDPAVIEPFSSAGNTRILFDIAGNRLSTAEVREKPEIVAPDGTNTTFFGTDIPEDSDAFPNFFGTSAAAPHAAAVAALMLQAAPGTDPATIYSRLESTALDMGAPGFDNDSGFGLIQAFPAIVISVPIDIKPGSLINPIILKSKGTIPVAILSTADFNAPEDVNPASLTFGRTGDEHSLNFKPHGQPHCSAAEVSGDGLLDLVCQFNTQATGFQAGDTVGILKGQTVLGAAIEGQDSVRIVGSVAGSLAGIPDDAATDVPSLLVLFDESGRASHGITEDSDNTWVSGRVAYPSNDELMDAAIAMDRPTPSTPAREKDGHALDTAFDRNVFPQVIW